MDGWRKRKKSLFQNKKKHFREFSEFSEMDKHNDTKYPAETGGELGRNFLRFSALCECSYVYCWNVRTS